MDLELPFLQCASGGTGVELTVRGAICILSVHPVIVLVRVESAAVDVSERRNPVTSSRIVILAHRDTSVVA